MNKGLILGAAAETLGDDWAAKHGGLKKKDLVTAAAEAFRHDPARDAAVDAAAARWLPPGFAPAEVAAKAPPEETAQVATEADASSDDTGSAASDEPSDSLPAESAATAATPVSGDGKGESAAPAESGAPAPTMSGNDAAESPADDGALPAFLTS